MARGPIRNTGALHEWPFPHFAWPESVPASLVAFQFRSAFIQGAIWLALARGISEISRATATAAFGLYLAMRIESGLCLLRKAHKTFLFEAGMSVLMMLTLANSVRGAVAYRKVGFAPAT